MPLFERGVDPLQEAMQPPRGRSSSFSSINIKATLSFLMSRPLGRDLNGDASASAQHLVEAGVLDSLQDVYADTVRLKDGAEGDRSSVERKKFAVRLQVRA